MQKLTNNFLAINIFGLKKYSHIKSIAKLLSEQDANVIKSSIISVGEVMNFTVLISGHWGAIAKIESSLVSIEKKIKTKIISQRTNIFKPVNKTGIKYAIHIVGVNNPEIFESVNVFLDQDFINVIEVKSQLTDNIVSYEILISLAEEVSLAKFRDQVLEFFDDQNLDVIIETKI